MMFIRKFTTEFGTEIHISNQENDWNTHRIYQPLNSDVISVSLLTLNHNASIEDALAYMDEVVFVIKQAAMLRNESVNA